MSCSFRLVISLCPLWNRWKSEQIRIPRLTRLSTPTYCIVAPRKTRLPCAPQSWIAVCRRLPPHRSSLYQPPRLASHSLNPGCDYPRRPTSRFLPLRPL